MLKLLMLCLILVPPVAERTDYGEPIHSEEPQLIEMLPGLSVAEGIVQFSAKIAVDAHHPDTPDVYLEMLITAPDSREHESLLVSAIRPSNLHAALLAAGMTPGSPMHKSTDGLVEPATGDQVDILVSTKSTQEDDREWAPLVEWVVHIETGKRLGENNDWNGIVFAGSRLTKNGYAADRAGTIASLTPFGDEVLSPTWTRSPSAEVDEPVWIVDRTVFPEKGTEVQVRIVLQEDTAFDETEESEEPDRIDIDRDS